MSRTLRSRWAMLLLALLASLAAPGLAVAHGVAHAHGAEEHHTGEHADDHHGDHPRHEHGEEHPDGTTLTESQHGHEHGHAGLEPAAAGKPDVRSPLATPLLIGQLTLVLPLAMHERPTLSRWDLVTLARPAPDTGPPPDLRAPPVC